MTICRIGWNAVTSRSEDREAVERLLQSRVDADVYLALREIIRRYASLTDNQSRIQIDGIYADRIGIFREQAKVFGVKINPPDWIRDFQVLMDEVITKNPDMAEDVENNDKDRCTFK